MFEGQRLLVTGGAGFIGSHLCDRLLETQAEKVIAVDNFFLGPEKMGNLENALTKKNSKRFGLHRKSCADPEQFRRILKAEEPGVVFNLAAIPLPVSHSNPAFVFQENANIALCAAEMLRQGRYGALVHFSSSEVYGTAQYVPMDEKHPKNPRTPYAAGKLAGDAAVESYEKTYGIDARIVRPFNNYGPRQNEKSYAALIPLTIKRIRNGEKPVIEGNGMQTRDFMHVTDTIEGTLKLLGQGKCRGMTVNLATGRETSVNEIVQAICGIMAYKGGMVRRPERPGDVRRHCGGIELAKELVGFEPKVGLGEGLKETVAWYDRNLGEK